MKLKKISVCVLACVMLAAFLSGGCRPKEQPPAADVRVKVSFNLNYSDAPEPPPFKILTVGAAYGDLPAPERESFEFVGWFFRDGTEQAVKTTVVTKTVNHTLYAKWLDGEGNEEPWDPPEEPEPDWDVDPDLYPQYNIPVYKKGAKMDIGAWSPYIGSQSGFNDMAAAGFTYAMPEVGQLDFAVDASAAKAALDRAAKAGVKILINDSGLSGLAFNDRNIWNTSRVDLYKNHSAFMGLFVEDEPHPASFPNAPGSAAWIKNEYGWMADKSEKFYQLFPSDKIFYVTLLPPFGNAADDKRTFGTTWEGYLNAILDMGASWLAMDHYVLVTINSKYAIDPYFMTCLERAKKVAVARGVPLNPFVLAMPHRRENPFCEYREAIEAEFRYQMAVQQAFGAESFIYFCYTTQEINDDNPEGWVNYPSLVSTAGEKLTKYYYAKNVNNEIQKWAHVFKSFTHKKTVAVTQTGTSSYNLFTPYAGSGQNPAIQLENRVASGAAISGVPGITSVTSNRHAVLGAFEDADGNKGFMLVNATNPRDNYAASATVKFGGNYKAALIYEKGAARVISLNASGEAQVSLEPGEGKFIIPLGQK